MNEGQSPAEPDGPWRIANGVCLILTGAQPEPSAGTGLRALTAALRSAGFPIRRSVLIGGTAEPIDKSANGLEPEPLLDLASAVADAVRQGQDLLILDACADPALAAITEMRRVASTDPMIAGVSPRFGHSALTAFPDRDTACGGEAVGAVLSRIFPAVTYVPLPDARCLYLKGSVVAEFRPASGNAVDWDAYAMAVSRYGFRMALANHAFVETQAKLETPAPPLGARAGRLEPNYPGTRRALASFASGAPHEAERILCGLLPDETNKRTVIFDLTDIGTRRSGTAEVAVALIRRAAAAWSNRWSVAVLASAAAHAAHFGAGTASPRRIDPADQAVCAAFIRIGQPFGWKDLDAAVRRAPALVFFMLDTIGLDCIRTAPDELDALWRFTLREADGLLFNSAFTERQFARRFGLRENQPRCVSLHSLDGRDYAGASGGESDGTILVIGNSFPHKRVEETARLLALHHPGRRVAALGVEATKIEGVAGYPSGSLDDKALQALYRAAALVVYPSLYEGFGLPVLEALAHRKPVLVRPLQPFSEIMAGTPDAANIHVFNSDDELLALVRADPRWAGASPSRPARTWDDALDDLRRILDEAVSAVDYDRVVRRIDFMRGRLEWARRTPFRDEPALREDVDRLAALAGRVAQGAVVRLASLPGGRALARLVRQGGKGRGSP